MIIKIQCLGCGSKYKREIECNNNFEAELIECPLCSSENDDEDEEDSGNLDDEEYEDEHSNIKNAKNEEYNKIHYNQNRKYLCNQKTSTKKEKMSYTYGNITCKNCLRELDKMNKEDNSKLGNNIKNKVINLSKQGFNNRQISNQLGDNTVSYQTVCKWIRESKDKFSGRAYITGRQPKKIKIKSEGLDPEEAFAGLEDDFGELDLDD